MYTLKIASIDVLRYWDASIIINVLEYYTISEMLIARALSTNRGGAKGITRKWTNKITVIKMRF